MDPRLRSLSKKEEKQPMDSIPTLMGLNGLIYKVPMDSSLSVQRNLQTFNFDSTSYNNASPSMSVNFQAGSGFINCATSYVSLELKVTKSDAEATQWGFGIGSASNLFRTNIVTTRSGAEVDRFQNANVILPHIHRGKNPAEWFKSVGALAGYSADVVEGKTDKSEESKTDNQYYSKETDSKPIPELIAGRSNKNKCSKESKEKRKPTIPEEYKAAYKKCQDAVASMVHNTELDQIDKVNQYLSKFNQNYDHLSNIYKRRILDYANRRLKKRNRALVKNDDNTLVIGKITGHRITKGRRLIVKPVITDD